MQNASYLVNDGKDRFGEQIYPKKPLENVPGPGKYRNLNMDVIKANVNKGYTIP
jgi:hypothetical protein